MSTHLSMEELSPQRLQLACAATSSSSDKRSSHRRRRQTTSTSSGSGTRAVHYGGVLLLVACLSTSSSWALTPASKTSLRSLGTAATSTLTALQVKTTTSAPESSSSSEMAADLEFTVPVVWEYEEESVEYSFQQPPVSTRKRQYNPVATDRSSVLSMGSLPNTDTNKEFELHVGKALDTLRHDYPHLLTTCPDLSIYDRNIEVVDPSGVKVHGLTTYQNSFRLLHALVKFLYCPSRSAMSFRMCYDTARRNIRIHWNAAVVPREFFGASRQVLHVDGISVYELDQESGHIVQHRIEQLLINNMPVQPKEGVIAALRDEHRVTVPSFFQPTSSSSSANNLNMLRFQPAGLGRKSLPSSLFAMEASESEKNNANANTSSSAVVFDPERFEAKNKSRQKFGLKPLTEEEFMEIELQVKQMDAEQKQRAAAAAASAAATKQEQKRPSFVEKLFGNVLKDTCESNWDCERPEVCCDFGFKKMCCSSGSLVADGVPQRALVPVPVDLGFPRNPEPGNY